MGTNYAIPPHKFVFSAYCVSVFPSLEKAHDIEFAEPPLQEGVLVQADTGDVFRMHFSAEKLLDAEWLGHFPVSGTYLRCVCVDWFKLIRMNRLGVLCGGGGVLLLCGV